MHFINTMTRLIVFFQAPKQQSAFSAIAPRSLPTSSPAISSNLPVKPAATPPRSLVAPSPVISSNVPVKPAEEDRIEPAQSAYSPVSLPPPKKLKNPFAAMEQQQSQQTLSPSTSSTSGGAKKLTWSERQALAKKQMEEDEAKSRSASNAVPPASPISKPVFKSSAPTFGRATAPQSSFRNFGAVGAAAVAGAVVGATAAFSARSIPPAPVPAPSSYTSAREAVQDAAWGTEEEAQTAVAETLPEPEYQPEPEAEPEPQYQAVSILSVIDSFAE
jgi:drebrin-like protein